jgi:hypothetical protein
MSWIRPTDATDGETIFSNERLPLGIFIIIALSLAVYSNALLNGLVYDDLAQVVENRWLRDLSYLREVFAKGVWGFSGDEQSNYYRPLMHVSYMLTYAVFGLRPWAFHLVNILLHAAVSVLVFFSALKLAKSAQLSATIAPPLLAALLFAAHPIHTEAVTWVAGIPELSFAFFYLWSFYLYMQAAEEDSQHPGLLVLLSLISFFLSTLSKETALTLPIVLVAYDFSFRKGSFEPLLSLKRYLPYALVAAAYFAIRTEVLGGFAHMKRHAELSNYEYFINVFPLISRYLEKLVLPLNLNVFYEFHPIHSILQAEGIVSLAVTCAFLLFVVLSYRKHKLAFFSASFIVIPLLPVRIRLPLYGETRSGEAT